MKRSSSSNSWFSNHSNLLTSSTPFQFIAFSIHTIKKTFDISLRQKKKCRPLKKWFHIYVCHFPVDLFSVANFCSITVEFSISRAFPQGNFHSFRLASFLYAGFFGLHFSAAVIVVVVVVSLHFSAGFNENNFATQPNRVNMMRGSWRKYTHARARWGQLFNFMYQFSIMFR